MEFLVEFDVAIPDGTPEPVIKARVAAEATAAAGLALRGHLLRLWTVPGKSNAVGLYRADSEAELEGLLGGLPLNGWMQVTVTPLAQHPNDPASPRPSSFGLPDPHLTPVYRLVATLGEPVHVEQVGHESVEATRVACDASREILRIVFLQVHVAALERDRETEDRGQRGPQVV